MELYRYKRIDTIVALDGSYMLFLALFGRMARDQSC